MTERTHRPPVLIDLGDDAPADPGAAPDLSDETAQLGAAMQGAIALGGRKGSRLGRWFFGLAGTLVSFMAGLAAWDYVTGLLARSPMLGWVALVLLAATGFVLAVIALRELAAFGRLRRIDHIQVAANAALAEGDLAAARRVLGEVRRLYHGRGDAAWGLARISEREPDVLDPDGLFSLVETVLLGPLDARARAEVEAAARQVATVTAIVPLALADVIAALTANIRMIRRIAEVYGGRSGLLGSWRLTRSVFAHLVATGAVAVGDDLIGSVAGGGILSKVSRRFGEGVINGGLTARVGVAAIEVCRPLPFRAVDRPSVSALVARALAGLFGQAKS